MIVRDEEDVLARCLDSVKDIVDEIIIVDTGSVDNTRRIAEKYTSQVFDFTWIDDFSTARNFSFSKAKMGYCLWLDADDILTDQDRAGLLKLKKTLTPDIDIVMMKYNTAFDEQGKVTFSYYRERLIKNHRGFFWKGAIHEAIERNGKTIYSEIAVTHKKLHPTDPDRNLRIFEKQLQQGIALCPREQFYYAQELYYHSRYKDAVAVLEDFLASGKGWLENSIEGCRLLSQCYSGLNEPKKALTSLLRSFEFDMPRAEVCCDIGGYFFNLGFYKIAAHWYKEALAQEPNEQSGAFIQHDCYGYLPCIQLCVCYDRLGLREQAIEYNNRAGVYKPNSPPYLSNLRYFAHC